MAVSPYLKSLAKVTPPRVDDNRINDIIGSATAPDVFEASQNLASEMMTNQLMLHDNGKVLSAAENEMFSTVISNTWGIDKDLVKADLPGFIERYTGIKVGNNWLQELGEYASTWADNKKLSLYQFIMNFLDPESEAYKKYEQLSDNITMNTQKKQKTFKDFGKFGTSVIEAAPTTMQLLEQLGIMVASAGAGALAGSAMGAGALVIPNTTVGALTLGAGKGAMLAGSTAVATMAGAATGTLVGQQLNLAHMDIIEAGGKAHEMRQMYNEDGSPMFTNKQIAIASTIYAAGIHFIEGYTEKLVNPIVKGMGINKLSKPLKNLFEKNFATRLLGYAWDTVGQSVQEGVEGMWSSVVSDMTKDLDVILKKNNVSDFDANRVKEEFKNVGLSGWEDFSQSLVGFGVGGIPSALLANMAGVNRMYFNPTQVNAQMRLDANTYFDGGQPINILALDTQGESWSREMEESMKDHKHHAIPVIMSETGLLTPINASDRAYVATLRESGATGASVIYVNRESGNENLAQYYASVIDEALVDTDVQMDEDYTPDTSLTENDENEINTSENGIIYGTSGNTILVNGSENISKVEQFFKDNERTSAIIHNEDGSVSIAVKENGRNTMLKIKALEESDTVKPEKVTPVQSYREWATLETERRVESDPFNTSNYLRNYEEKMAFDEIDKALPENDKMTFEEKRALQFSKLGAARIMPIVSEVTGINTSDLLKKFTFTFDTGRLGDMAYGGMEESNGQYKITINKKVRPDTIMHEILHGLRRLATKEQLSGFASAYGGTEGAMWASDIEKTDGGYRLGDKVYKTYSEAFEAVRANEERFVDDFMRYLYGEEGFTDSQKSFFAQVKEFFENFWDRMRELLAPKLSAETVRAFDILFGKDTPVQERADFVEVAATEGIRTAVDLANTGLEDAIERDEENGLDEEGNTLWQRAGDINSEQFINWFKGSKVVNSDGSPMVVYHGTNELFEDFEHGKASNTYANSAKNGFFFTSNRRVADSYLSSRRLERIESGEIVDIPTNPRVMEVYLHMENPLEFNAKSGEKKTWNDIFEEAKKNGHDGIIIRNIIDAKTGVLSAEERQYYGEADDYIVFSNDQIRIKNSGLPENNALYQRIMDRNTQARIDADYEAVENALRADSSNFDSDGNHLAPNGKKSNLTYKQWVQVRTPAFMRWFGDWLNDPENASKIIDENGEPLVVYHGSNAVFDVFDRATNGSNTGNYGHNGAGFYFTDNIGYAKGYGHKVYEVFLNIKNPLFPTRENLIRFEDFLGLKTEKKKVINKKVLSEELSKLSPLAKRMVDDTLSLGYAKAWENLFAEYEGRESEISDLLNFESLSDMDFDWALQMLQDNTKVDKEIIDKLGGGRRFYDYKYTDDSYIPQLDYALELGSSEALSKGFTEEVIKKGYDGLWTWGEIVAYNPNQIKSATDNSGAFSTDNVSILYQANEYDPRIGIPKVRNGWTQEKIIKYLKANPTWSGVSKAINLIKEFDSWQELKDHMFYHGSSFGAENLKPSITMSDREVERVGGGGYGEKYWAISLSKSKKVASNFSGMGGSVNIYPVILAKNAKVVELEDVQDSADLEDKIVDLYTQGVDAVWIGGGEQELAVINPRAVVNIGTPDSYRVFHLGWEDNPLNIKNDEQIKEMYEYAKQYTPKYAERDFGKPRKPSRFFGENFERKDEEVYKKELEEYEKALDEWYSSDNYKQYYKYERERDRTILFQLSDEDKKNAIEARKRDIETATAGGYWVRTEYIEEFAGEDWADRELKVRHWMQEKPDDYKELKDIARRVGDYQEFKEELHKKYEDNWFDEDESFYKRIYQLAQTRTAQEKDSEFIARNVMGDDNLLKTAKALRGYADLDFVPKPGRRSGGYYKVVGQLNRAKGVSNKVRSLSNGERGSERSTSEEIQTARELILKNPRVYRMAYERAMLGENRASIIRGIEDKKFEVNAVRQESNDLTMDYDLDTLDDRLEAELYSMEEEQLQAERKANLNKAKQTDWKKTAAQLEKKLAQANADLEKLNTEKLSRQQAQKERDKAISERNELRKQMTELQNELSETKAERREFKAQRDERRQRVNELRKQLVDANRKVRTLSRILDAYQRKAEAVNAKNARLEMIQTIKKTVPIGKNSFGASGNYDARYLDAFAFIQGLFGKQDRSELNERRSELISIIKNYQEQGAEPSEYQSFLDELDMVRALINASEMRTVPAMLQPYTMALHLDKGENAAPAYLNSLQMKADSRQSMWTLDELSDILNVAQKVAFDARSLKIQRDEVVRERRRGVVDKYFSQTYSDYDPFMEREDLEDLIMRTPTLQHGSLMAALYGYKIANGMIGRMSRLFDGNKEGVLYDFFTRQARKLAESELGQISRRLEAGEKKFKELGLKTSDLNKQFFFNAEGEKEKYTIFHSGSGEKLILTKGDMIGVYVYMQNEDGAEKIQSAFGNGISPEDARRIVDALSDAEKAWGDYIIEDMSSQWARIDNVYYEVFNMNLGKVQRYFPLISQNKLSKEMEDSIIMVGPDGDAVRWVNKSMTKERVHHAIYPLQLNVSKSWTSNVRKQEHFMAFAEWSRDANYYLSNHGYIGEIITKKFGKEAEDSLQDFVNSINSPKMYQDEDDKRLASIVGRGASAAIVGNISVMLKQIPTMASAIGNVGIKEFFSSAIAPNVTLENFLKANNIMFEYGDKASDFIGANSPIMRNRRFGMELVGETGGIGKSNIDNLSAKISDKLMKVTAGFTDKYVTSTLWLARYMTVFNELKEKAEKNHKAFDVDKAHEEAVFKAGQLISETQNTSVPMDMSQRMRKAKANPYMKPFYLFSSVGMNVFNMITYDIPYSFRNKDIKGIAKTVSFVLINVLATMAINGSIVKKDNEDDEEYQKRIRNQLIGQAVGLAIPGWGSMLSNAISGNTYGSSADIALISDASTVLRKAFNPSENKTGWENLGSLLESLGYVTAEGFGLPANLSRKTFNAIKNGNMFYLVNSTWGDLMGDK